MCGIAAIFAYGLDTRLVDPMELIRIRDAMARRGPDGSGAWMADYGRAVLGHRRLSIIDPTESGAQPMATEDGAAVIVFNGEIYNYRALRAELEQRGVRFRSGSDTEVVLELYRHHGPAMLERLRGMFALAIWDDREKGLLIARDGLGIKPLYIADDGQTIRLASQVKALVAGGRVDTGPDPAGHAGFFLWGHVPEPYTLYRGIQAFKPGTWLWQGMDGDRRQGTFFDLGAELRAPRLLPPGLDLKSALEDSVEHHLVADVPVGVFLSAGLDSSTLAAMAARRTGGRLLSVTLAFAEFEGTDQDEAPLAERAAHQFGTDHATTRIPAGDFAEQRDRILADMDQPTIDGVNVWFVARAAAARGLKVALSGLGGDELFAGYDNFTDIPRMVRWLGPFGAVPALGRGVRRLSAGLVRPPKLAGVLEYGTTLPDAYLLRRGLFMPWELGEVMDPDMARVGLERLDPRLRLAETVAGLDDQRIAISALEMQFYMRNQLLRDADWAGMAHSVEIRVPLVDTELLRAVLALRAAGRAPGKRDMALAADPPLPQSILNRPKTGFSVPVAQWLGETSLRGWAKRVHAAAWGQL